MTGVRAAGPDAGGPPGPAARPGPRGPVGGAGPFVDPDRPGRPFLPGGGLLLVAHGSRDPRAAWATGKLCRAVRTAHPGPVDAAYLDFTAPRLTEVLAAPDPPDVVVPLLLTEGYHGRVDIPGELARCGHREIRLAGVLGPAARAVAAPTGSVLEVGVAGAVAAPTGSVLEVGVAGAVAGRAVPADAVAAGAADAVVVDLLVAALVRRLREVGAVLPAADGAGAGSPAVDAVVLAGAGTRDTATLAGVDLVAVALGDALGLPCRPGYAAGAGPGTDVAVAALRSAGARRVAVAGYFLAPGLLYDRAGGRARRAGAVLVAPPLGDAPEVVELILHRVASAQRPDRTIPAEE